MATTSIATIEFHGQSLITLQHDGQPFAAMKPIVEGMGLDWKSQHSKITSNQSRFCMVEITMQMPGDDQQRSVSCMPLRKLPGWLMTIHPNKIKDLAVRERVVMYQNECDDALWQYWSQGEAINPRSRPEKTRKALPNGLTIEQQETIKKIVKDKADALPHDKRAKATITCWSALKAKFGVTYKEIAPEHFTDAVSLLSRITLEGEYIPAGVSTEKDELSYATGRAILSDIRQLANAYLSGTEQRIMMTECDKLERVLVSGFTEMNESLMRIQSAAFMLSRWSKH